LCTHAARVLLSTSTLCTYAARVLLLPAHCAHMLHEFFYCQHIVHPCCTSSSIYQHIVHPCCTSSSIYQSILHLCCTSSSIYQHIVHPCCTSSSIASPLCTCAARVLLSTSTLCTHAAQVLPDPLKTNMVLPKTHSMDKWTSDIHGLAQNEQHGQLTHVPLPA